MKTKALGFYKNQEHTHFDIQAHTQNNAYTQN